MRMAVNSQEAARQRRKDERGRMKCIPKISS
jgi:hypothetical protein